MLRLGEHDEGPALAEPLSLLRENVSGLLQLVEPVAAPIDGHHVQGVEKPVERCAEDRRPTRKGEGDWGRDAYEEGVQKRVLVIGGEDAGLVPIHPI